MTTTLSYDEAARQYAKAHKVDLDTARMAVADLYLEAATDRTGDDETHRRMRFDRPIPDDGLYYHPRPKIEGRPIAIDTPRSIQGQVARARAVAIAKANGDYYRELSAATSTHRIGD